MMTWVFWRRRAVSAAGSSQKTGTSARNRAGQVIRARPPPKTLLTTTTTASEQQLITCYPQRPKGHHTRTAPVSKKNPCAGSAADRSSYHGAGLTPHVAYTTSAYRAGSEIALHTFSFSLLAKYTCSTGLTVSGDKQDPDGMQTMHNSKSQRALKFAPEVATSRVPATEREIMRVMQAQSIEISR